MADETIVSPLQIMRDFRCLDSKRRCRFAHPYLYDFTQWLMTRLALFLAPLGVVRRRRLDLTSRIMADETIVSPLQIMRDLRRLDSQRRCCFALPCLDDFTQGFMACEADAACQTGVVLRYPGSVGRAQFMTHQTIVAVPQIMRNSRRLSHGDGRDQPHCMTCGA